MTRGLTVRFRQKWVPSAIAAGVIPNVIVDANHSMAYLKYAATRQLLTTTGQDQDNSQRLSSVSADINPDRECRPVELSSRNPSDQASLKKVMTMLGRVRRRQVDDSARCQPHSVVQPQLRVLQGTHGGSAALAVRVRGPTPGPNVASVGLADPVFFFFFEEGELCVGEKTIFKT